MGYFSNGTEGDSYREKYCSRCAHYDPEGDKECPVWEAHLSFNYDQHTPEGKREGPVAQILDQLIPRDAKVGNAKCAMFLARVGGSPSERGGWKFGGMALCDCLRDAIALERKNAGEVCDICVAERARPAVEVAHA